MSFVTATELQELRGKIRSNPPEALSILNQIFYNSEILLDSSSSSIFEDIIRYNGAAGANIILNNLSKIQSVRESDYYASNLAGLILSYSPADTTTTIQNLLNWNFALIGTKSILEKIGCKSLQDVNYYRQIISQSVQSTKLHNFVLADFIFSLIINSPGFEEQIFDTLSEVKTNMSLSSVVKYLVENQIGLQALYNKLDVIARVSPNSTSIADYLLIAFPDKKVQALFKYIKNSPGDISLDSTISDLAKIITLSEFQIFLPEIESYWTKQFFSSKLVLNLLLNPNLPPNIVVNSRTSLRLYQSILEQVNYLTDAFRSNNQRFGFVDLLHFIVADPAFVKLDKNFHSEIIRSIRHLQPSPSLTQLHLRLLLQIDFSENLFNDDFLESLLNEGIDLNIAKAIIGKIVAFGQYPFYNLEFMAHLLLCTDDIYFKKMILNIILPLFPKEYDLEKIFLILSEYNHHNFAYIYIKNKRKLASRFSKYSSKARQIQINCWRKLSFGQRLRSMLPW